MAVSTGSDRARHSYLPEAAEESGPRRARASSVGKLGLGGADGCNYQGSGEASREPCEYAELHTDDLLQKCGAGYRAPGPSVTSPLVSLDPDGREGPAQQAGPYCSPGTSYPGRRKQKEPDTFNGEIVEWADFITHFDMVVTWNDRTYTEKGLQLATCLWDKAQKVLGSIPESQRSDYEAMKFALEERFSPPHRENAKQSKTFVYRVSLGSSIH